MSNANTIANISSFDVHFVSGTVKLHYVLESQKKIVQTVDCKVKLKNSPKDLEQYSSDYSQYLDIKIKPSEKLSAITKNCILRQLSDLRRVYFYSSEAFFISDFTCCKDNKEHCENPEEKQKYTIEDTDGYCNYDCMVYMNEKVTRRYEGYYPREEDDGVELPAQNIFLQAINVKASQKIFKSFSREFANVFYNVNERTKVHAKFQRRLFDVQLDYFDKFYHEKRSLEFSRMFSIEIPENAPKKDAMDAFEKNIQKYIDNIIQLNGESIQRDRFVLKCLTCAYGDTTNPEYIVENLTFFFQANLLLSDYSADQLFTVMYV